MTISNDIHKKIMILLILIVFSLNLSSCNRQGTIRQNPSSDSGDEHSIWHNEKSGTLESIAATRQDLFDSKVELLNQVIASMKQKDDFMKMKSAIFAFALSSYEKYILPTHNKEKIIVTRNADNKTKLDEKMAALSKVDIIYNKNFMFYHQDINPAPQEIHVYVDFANASIGGGHFGGGFVQEEQMVALCPDFALYLAGEHGNTMLDEPALAEAKNSFYISRISRNTGEETARPLMFANFRCPVGFDRNQDVLAAGNRETSIIDKILADPLSVMKVNPNAPAIIVLAIAAVNISKLKSQRPGKLYLDEDELDLFTNTYKGFELIKLAYPTEDIVIHTGAWGGGVFEHSRSMSIALQVLAAKILGVKKLVFHGIDPKPAVKELEKFLNGANFNANTSLREVLKKFLAHVNNLGTNFWKINNGA